MSSPRRWRCEGCGRWFNNWPVTDSDGGDGHIVPVAGRDGDMEPSQCGPVVEVDLIAELVEALEAVLNRVGDRIEGSVQFCADCGADWLGSRTEHFGDCAVANAEAVLARVRSET